MDDIEDEKWAEDVVEVDEDLSTPDDEDDEEEEKRDVAEAVEAEDDGVTAEVPVEEAGEDDAEAVGEDELDDVVGAVIGEEVDELLPLLLPPLLTTFDELDADVATEVEDVTGWLEDAAANDELDSGCRDDDGEAEDERVAEEDEGTSVLDCTVDDAATAVELGEEDEEAATGGEDNADEVGAVTGLEEELDEAATKIELD